MSKNPLLIAVDLDGTLLTDDKEISGRTKRALNAAVHQGHRVVIATGRPFRASMDYYTELGLDTPIVNFNGALVHHPRQHDWGLFHSPLDAEIAQQIIETSTEFGVQNIMVEVMDDVYMQNEDEYIREVFIEGNQEVNDLPHPIHLDPTSVLIYPHEHNVRQLRDHLDTHHAEVIEHRKWGAPWHVIEIVKNGLNKAVGLERICRTYSIPPSRVIAFGDEDNDFEMIEFAGTGVAMQN
jgi:5-amino-6-(5-phospho-D-ribitylamino)uracil phosphatase